jgi:hypothetical protein
VIHVIHGVDRWPDPRKTVSGENGLDRYPAAQTLDRGAMTSFRGRSTCRRGMIEPGDGNPADRSRAAMSRGSDAQPR